MELGSQYIGPWTKFDEGTKTYIYVRKDGIIKVVKLVGSQLMSISHV